ncbi:hemoglobin [Melghirimyces profundicolus]|uniref:Hemoglobin n=1 Tax=Melghirimyces profundicolus TaxID=1242148 RepID=A0A2T6B2R3_9BACL|nr:group 1 truncated hemoglobin [Melghirimyces profundicolus]PTX50344.1 hemoglobin [Melghirimyces profundicolus]
MHELSLYELLGDDGVASIVNEFYDRMFADERVRHYFEGADTHTLRTHQMYFLVSYALGGPNIYKGTKLSKAHQGLNITDQAYEITIRHMNRALRNHEVPLEICSKIEAFMRGVKPHIVNK